ncbi:MAG: DUF1080 domain-containing protein [Roseibacillus sp.]|nr:DUF1080 domain-containing protein [Roseibacillus sp.]
MVLSGAGEKIEGKEAEQLLETLLPDGERVAQLERLIEQLGSEKFSERKAAMEQLLAAPLIPARLLGRGLKSDNPEIRNRTREISRQGGARKSQAVFEDALRALLKEGRKGLLGKVVEVMENGVTIRDAALAARATVETVVEGDLALLQRLAGGDTATARGMAAVGGEVLGPHGMPILRILLKDRDSPVKLRAAIGLANQGSLEGARTLGEFLLSGDATERMKAWKGLRSLTGREFGYNALDSVAKRREGAAKWIRFLRGEVALTGKVKELKSAQLFNGKDLTGWTHYRRGKAVEPGEKTWSIEEGVLVCPGMGPGDLRTNDEFENYLLVISYRAAEPGADSGVGVMMTGVKGKPADRFRFDGGDYLEVQLLPGRSGDLYRIGDFKAQVEGKDLGFAHRRKIEVEEPLNQWHEMRLQVRDGQVKVYINGVLVNEASGREGPGRIVLREERSQFEFREISLLPAGE